MPIRVLLADDHAAFRRSLRQILDGCPDLEVVAEAASGSEAVSLAREYQPDVAVLDVRMSDMTGIQAIPRIRQCSPQTAIMMLSVHRDLRYLAQALKAGAREYVAKDSTEGTLLSAIRRVYRERP